MSLYLHNIWIKGSMFQTKSYNTVMVLIEVSSSAQSIFNIKYIICFKEFTRGLKQEILANQVREDIQKKSGS